MFEDDLIKYTELKFGPYFKSIMENSKATCILIMNTGGQILDCNEGFMKYFGYDKEDLIGQHLRINFIKEDREKNVPEHEIHEVLEKGNSMDKNYLLHKDGSYVWVHGESILVNNGGNSFILKIIFDINEQKLLEMHLLDSHKELNNRVKELDQMNKELDTFVHTASHDLKGPINNMEGLVNTLKEDLSAETEENIAPLVHMLQLSIEKLRSTVVDLTATARLKTEGGFAPELVSLHEILHEVKINLYYEINNSEAEISEHFSDTPLVKVSKKNLKSILYNLLSNSIKFRRPELAPRIQVSCKEKDGFYIFEVKDNGLGIKEEDKPRVFAMYSRIHEHVEGAGVGMSNVAKIVSNSNGKIEVESEEGKGSVFKVYLPVIE